MRIPRFVRAFFHHVGRLLTFLYLLPICAFVAIAGAFIAVITLAVFAAPIYAWLVAGEWAWDNYADKLGYDKGATLFISGLPYSYYPDARGCEFATLMHRQAGEKNVECRRGNRDK